MISVRTRVQREEVLRCLVVWGGKLWRNEWEWRSQCVDWIVWWEDRSVLWGSQSRTSARKRRSPESQSAVLPKMFLKLTPSVHARMILRRDEHLYMGKNVQSRSITLSHVKRSLYFCKYLKRQAISSEVKNLVWRVIRFATLPKLPRIQKSSNISVCTGLKLVWVLKKSFGFGIWDGSQSLSASPEEPAESIAHAHLAASSCLISASHQSASLTE